ncbi:MAG: VOC family protein [Spirochaetes bacterium]|jgi:predicted enzyme related to lactoylglutathione lyase|nr:VOC family protein [Spirochaetota bacterium]
MIFESIDRVVIAAKDLEKSIKFFKDLLDVDFDVVGTHEELKITGAYGASGLEIIEPYGKDSGLLKYLETKGEGIMAIVLKVKDMDAAVAHLEKKGLRKVMDIKVGTMREVGFNPNDTCGFQIILAEYPAKHPATIAAWALEKPAR